MAEELDVEAIMERCRRLWKESMDRGEDATEVRGDIGHMYHEVIRLRTKLQQTEEAIDTIRSAVGAKAGESTVEAFYRGLGEVQTHTDAMVDAALARSKTDGG